MGEDLTVLVWKLINRVVAGIAECRKVGGLIPIRALYTKLTVKEFGYKEPGFITFASMPTDLEREEWHWKDEPAFLLNVRQSPEYIHALSEIKRRYQKSDAEADQTLSTFVQIVVHTAVDPLENEHIVEMSGMLMDDLNGNPVDWSVQVTLDGIWLEDEEIRLADGTILRRPNASDLELEVRKEELWASNWLNRETGSAILEFTQRSVRAVEVQAAIESTLDLLRLFRLGSVLSVGYKARPDSFLRRDIKILSWGHWTPYRYALSNSDKAALEEFLDRLRLVLPPHPSLNPSPFEMRAVDVAFLRYKDALLQPAAIEGHITSAITCLEALFLKAKERMELSHRLGQRVAALLRLLGFAPMKVYKEVKQAYNVRSTFIHGSLLDGQQQKTAGELCKTVLDYARVSLLVFMQLTGKIEKDALVGKLDNSLLDEEAVGKLKELIGADLVITK